MDIKGYTSTTGVGVKRSGVRIFLSVLFSVLLLGSCARWVASMVPKLMAPATTPDQLEAAASVIATAQRDGLLVRYTCEENQAHVQPAPWRALNQDLKKELTAALATTCQAAGHGHRMMVVDFRTGRDLANFSSGSFRVY